METNTELPIFSTYSSSPWADGTAGSELALDPGPISATDFSNSTNRTLEDMTSGERVDPAFGIVLACLTIPVALVGVFANAVVLVIIIRFENMHNAINYSFANLALADLLGLLLDAVPSIVLTLKQNPLTNAGCKTLLYLPWTIRQVACLTLAYLAFDRYRLIIHPVESVKSRSPRSVMAALIVIWLVSSILQLPTAFLTGTDETMSCREFLPDSGGAWYYWTKLITIYFIPVVIIFFCYFRIWKKLTVSNVTSSSRGSMKMRTYRRRSVRRIFLIVIVFALCWPPIFVVHIWPHYDASVTEDTPRYAYVHRLTNFVLYVVMMLNPFLYAFAGEGFRKHFRRFMDQSSSSSTGDMDRTPDASGVIKS